MGHVDGLALALDQLDDVVAGACFEHLGNLSGFEVEGHGFKFGVEGAAFHEAEVAALGGAARVVGVQACEHGELFAPEHALAVLVQACFHRLNLLIAYRRNLHDFSELVAGGHDGQTVGAQVSGKLLHFRRGYGDVARDLGLHLLDESLVVHHLLQVFLDLGHRLVEIFLNVFGVAAHLLEEIGESRIDAVVNLLVRDLDAVQFGLVHHQLVVHQGFQNVAAGLFRILHCVELGSVVEIVLFKV